MQSERGDIGVLGDNVSAELECEGFGERVARHAGEDGQDDCGGDIDDGALSLFSEELEEALRDEECAAAVDLLCSVSNDHIDWKVYSRSQPTTSLRQLR